MEELSKMYSWRDAKADSDRLLWARKLSQKLKAMNREVGYTIVSLLFAFSFGLTGLVGMARV